MLLNCNVGEDSWVPGTARRSNQSILKKICPEYSLEGLMLKLKLQYFGHLMQRTDLLEKPLMLGKTEDRRRRWWQRMRWLDDITDSMDMSLSKLQNWWTGKPGILQSLGSQRVGHGRATELNWWLFDYHYQCYFILHEIYISFKNNQFWFAKKYFQTCFMPHYIAFVCLNDLVSFIFSL